MFNKIWTALAEILGYIIGFGIIAVLVALPLTLAVALFKWLFVLLGV